MPTESFLHQSQEYKPTDSLPFLRTDSSEQPVVLKALDIQVMVTGLYAETTQTMTFYNSASRDLEGELRFPLPDNATVCGYALDIQGNMVDGVVVPKKMARRVLESEIRKGVDPGLIEQTQGNVYTTRIYPVPAKGTRTVQIRYLSDLVVRENAASYHLPLGHVAGIDKATLKVEVEQSPLEPVMQLDGNTSLKLWSSRWVAETELETTNPINDLLIQLPGIPDKCVFCEQSREETFFSINMAAAPPTSTPWQPRRIAVAWDASGSRCPGGNNSAKREKEFGLLTTLFERWQLERVDLLVFRNRKATEVSSFTSAACLTEHLDTIAYDGATAIAELDLRVFAKDTEACLLFSDGLESCAPKKYSYLSNSPLLTINSSPACNSTLLKHLAVKGQGQYINLLHCSIEEAVTAMENTNNRLHLAGTTDCEEVVCTNGNSRFTVLGKLSAPKGTVDIVGPVRERHRIRITAKDAADSSTIAHFWAGRRVRELEAGGAGEEELINFCRQYGIVSQSATLLVLENLEQYLEHGVAPPPSLPGMRRQYQRMMKLRQVIEQKQVEKHIDQVASLWEERKKWWERDFKTEYQEQQQRKYLHKLLGRPEMRQPLQADIDESTQTEEPCFCLSGEVDESPDDFLEDFSGNEGAEENAPSGLPGADSTITIHPWDPDTPYLQQLKESAKWDRYATYLQQRRHYGRSPSFFLDCAHFFLEQGQTDLGLRILSNLLELRLDDVALLRIYGWRLQQAGYLDLAIPVFERILALRDDEPQSHRDLALALSDRWQAGQTPQDLARAMEFLYAVICRKWDRFEEIELIALMELNRLVWLARKQGIAIPDCIDNRLLDHLDLDIRISLSWDADLTDVDLHVFEPDGCHAYYSHRLTGQGGLVSRDFTQGYGPEEYILRRAMPGKYLIKAHYYGSHQQTVCGPCTVTATVFTNFGRENEQQQTLTLRLDKASDQELVGEVEIEGKPWQALPPAAVRKKGRPERTLQHFQVLKPDMTISEVTSNLGSPDIVEGEDAVLLAYILQGNEAVHLVFTPRLESATRITEQGQELFLGKRGLAPDGRREGGQEVQALDTQVAVNCLSIVRLLARAGYITNRQCREVEDIHTRTRLRANRVLLSQNIIEEDTIGNFLSRYYNYDLFLPEEHTVSLDALTMLSYRVAKKYLALPTAVQGDILHVAMVDPIDEALVDQLAQETGMTVNVLTINEYDLLNAYKRYYGISDAEYNSFLQ